MKVAATKKRNPGAMIPIAFICGILCLGLSVPCIAKQVPINPITSDIRDKIRESSQLISRVEENMAPKVNDLETIYKSYEPCKKKQNDSGCVEIEHQIKLKYKDVLSTMAGDLPNLKKTIKTTAIDLGNSVRSQTRTKSFKELYDHVSTKGRLPKPRGPLSKKLSDLLKALGKPSTNISILELSLQTQADLISASQYLDYLEAELSRQIMLVDMDVDFGILSPEIATVMQGVTEIFGYNADFGGAAIEEDATPESKDWR